MSQVKCPYCGSVQVKAMANQPKKYPRPTDPTDLANWQKGYDCKKCGNDFIVTPPKPLGFFAKLCGWILLGLVAWFLYSAFTSTNKDKIPTDHDAKLESAAEEKPQDKIDATPEQNPLDQEFSKEAEEAAHAYIPPETKESIADSQDQNETLSIKTTIRKSE